MRTYDTCVGCGQRPVCRLAEATVIVTARDFLGVVTGLCVRCGGGEDADDNKGARVEEVDETTKTQTKTKERGR